MWAAKCLNWGQRWWSYKAWLRSWIASTILFYLLFIAYKFFKIYLCIYILDNLKIIFATSAFIIFVNLNKNVSCVFNLSKFEVKRPQQNVNFFSFLFFLNKKFYILMIKIIILLFKYAYDMRLKLTQKYNNKFKK